MSREQRLSFGQGTGRGVYFKWLAKKYPERMRKIASKGGETSQANGTAHQWTAEDGRNANTLRRTRGHRGMRRTLSS